MFYMETGSLDPCYNLAFEEYILENKRGGDWLMLWQNAGAVVIGLNQIAEEEIDIPFAREHGVTVVRRMSGGGAVYHDLGNLNYSFITDAGDPGTLSMERFTAPVCEALSKLGVKASAAGRNDITVEGKKISGAAQRLCGHRILHHGTLLFQTDLETAAGALRADPGKFASKSTKSVRSRMGNIRDYLERELSLEDFKTFMLRELAGDALVYAALEDAELSEIRALADGKYRSWDWTFGASPPFQTEKSARFAGGLVGVRLDVRRGRIARVRFFGDFMGRMPLDELENALRGRRYAREEAAAVFGRFSIPDLFGSVTEEELMRVMFQ
jgi:lipoate-protein ligase A